MTITSNEHSTLEKAFDFFNHQLFGGTLSPCLITLQRTGRYCGYFSPACLSHRHTGDTTDQIALNLSGFVGLTDEVITSVLLHEMVHKHQFEFGKPGNGRYHNREWATMMIERGLIPSDTGVPGGRKIGQSMSHYIVEGGPFHLAFRMLMKNGFRINWQERET